MPTPPHSVTPPAESTTSPDHLRAVADRMAGSGDTALAAIARFFLDHYRPRLTTDTRLTERQEQVVRLLAHGYSNKEIAAKMGVSVKTVETFKSRAMEKLGVKTRVALVRCAARRGWLNPDAPDWV